MSLEDMEVRIGKIETELTDAKEDIASIRTHVTNHIPHILEDIKSDIKKINKKIVPLETKAQKVQGVSEFLSVILKGIGILAAATWTVVQIIKNISGML